MKNFVLFDFDGVIADSFQAAFEVSSMIHPGLTPEEYKGAFEGNINQWERKISHLHGESRTDIDFFAEYIPRMKNKVTIVSGIAEIIKKLAESYDLIIVSSTISSPISEFLEKYDLTTCFKEVLGNDVHHSKVEKIKMIFEKYGISQMQCVFITDTLGDMIEAEKTGIGAIGVSWGFHTHETLQQGKPFSIVDKPNDLPKVVSRFFDSVS